MYHNAFSEWNCMILEQWGADFHFSSSISCSRYCSRDETERESERVCMIVATIVGWEECSALARPSHLLKPQPDILNSILLLFNKLISYYVKVISIRL